MKTLKSGFRVLGIAESFVRGATRSVLAGVVMRRDLVIDGSAFSSAEIGGTDATDAVIEIVDALDRRDLNCLMLSGCVISWFNIIDPKAVYESTNIPVIGVTYEDSAGLAGDIAVHFPGDSQRIEAYERLGTRTRHMLGTGYEIFLRSWGIEDDYAYAICDSFTKNGRVPEPLKVARLISRAAMRYFP